MLPQDYTLLRICKHLRGRDVLNLSLVNQDIRNVCLEHIKPNYRFTAGRNKERAILLAEKGYKVKLSLSCEPSITDVSMLGKMHYLDLTACPVTDVSALGNVDTLILDRVNLTDVDISALANVRKLFLVASKVKDLSVLNGVEILCLAGIVSKEIREMLPRVRFI